MATRKRVTRLTKKRTPTKPQDAREAIAQLIEPKVQRWLEKTAETDLEETGKLYDRVRPEHPRELKLRDRRISPKKRADELVDFLQAVALGKRSATEAEVKAVTDELNEYLPDLPDAEV